MRITLTLGLAVVSLTLAACQSKSFKVVGTGDGLRDGDTLYLTNDLNEGTPLDTIVVKDGKFEYEGESDSISLCMVYLARQHDVNVPFFNEPGTIKVHLSNDPNKMKVSGTLANDRWQEYTDTMLIFGANVNAIATQIYNHQLTSGEQAVAMAKIDSLNKRFAQTVYYRASRNIDNEFGYFLVMGADIDRLEPCERMALLEKMPAEFKERPAAKRLKGLLDKELAYTVGKPFPQLTMNDTNGNPIDILNATKRNKLTVIDFWASWCGPCRKEMPTMVKLYNDYHGKGLDIIGISLDNDKGAWTKATNDLGMKWRQVSDLKGWESAAANLFSVSSIPHTIVVDKSGKIVARGLRGEQLLQLAAERLK